MTGGGDPDNRRDFPGGWGEDAKNAFTEAGRTREQQEIFAYVQTLLRFRREHPALRSGRLWHLFSDEGSSVFMRETEEERVLLVFNNSARARGRAIPTGDTPAQGGAEVSRLFGGEWAQRCGKGV